MRRLDLRGTACAVRPPLGLPVGALQPGLHLLLICQRVTIDGAVPAPPQRRRRRWRRRLLLLNGNGRQGRRRRPLLHLHLWCTWLLLLCGLRLRVELGTAADSGSNTCGSTLCCACCSGAWSACRQRRGSHSACRCCHCCCCCGHTSRRCRKRPCCAGCWRSSRSRSCWRRWWRRCRCFKGCCCRLLSPGLLPRHGRKVDALGGAGATSGEVGINIPARRWCTFRASLLAGLASRASQPHEQQAGRSHARQAGASKGKSGPSSSSSPQLTVH